MDRESRDTRQEPMSLEPSGSEWRGAEADLETRARQQAAVAELGLRALTGTEPSALMDEAVALIARTLDVEYCKVLELLPDGGGLLLRAGVGWRAGLVGQAIVDAGTNSQAGYTLSSSEPVIVEDLECEDRFTGPLLLVDHGVRSGVSVIIPGGDRPFGVLGAHTVKQRPFTRDDIHFLQAMANVLAQAIERKRSEEALGKSEATARALLESAAEGILIVDREGRIVSANAKAEKMFGFRREELLGHTLEILIPERVRTAHSMHRAAYFAEPRVRPMGVGLDLAGRRKDGTEFPVEISLSYIKTEDGLVAMASITDITERKRAEKRQSTQFVVTQVLAESATLTEAVSPLLRAICAGLGWELGELWVVEPARNFLRWAGIWHAPSLDATEFAAVSREVTFPPGSGLAGGVWATGEPAWIADLLSDRDFHRMAVADRTGLRAAMAFPVHSERGVGSVMVFYSREIRPLDPDLLRIMNDIGSRIGQFIERKRAEEELARLGLEAQVREAFIRNVVESIQDGIIVLDRQGRITEWNRAMAQNSGIAAPEARGRPLLELFPTLRARGFEKVFTRLRDKEEGVTLEGLELETGHRGRITVNIKGSSLRAATGEVIGAVLALEDVTERLQLERSARQSEKMAAIGTLAAGIAHEINNPIGIISSRVELMLMEAGEKRLVPDAIKDLQVVEKHAGRVARITQGLLSFSRQAPWRLASVNVNQVVESVLLLVEKQLSKEGIALKKDLAPDLPEIQGSANHLEQVIVNLVTNAREAMPGGGALEVSTTVHRSPMTDDRTREGWGGHWPSVIDGSAVEIRVGDTGPGIPAENLPRIFDPFYTTKEQGTGLGLSISYGIVREHGGAISVASRPGEGSTFLVRLPIPGGTG